MTGVGAREEEDGADRRAQLGSERKGGNGCWHTVLGRACWAEQAEAVVAELGWWAGAEGEKREPADG